MKTLLLPVLLLWAITGSASAQAPASVVSYTFRAVWSRITPRATAEAYEAWNVTVDFVDSGTSNLRYGVHYAFNQPSVDYLAPGSSTYSYSPGSAGAANLTLGINGTDPLVLQFTSATQGSIVSGLGPFGQPLGTFTLLPTGSDSSTQALVNLSTLFTVSPGTPFTCGFVIGGGTQLREILIRAIGPGLSQFGVTNYATEPTYRLAGQGEGDAPLGGLFPFFRGDHLTWSATATAEATLSAETGRVHTFPLLSGSHDKANIYLLAPGAYTISVGAQAGSGMELLEVYEVP